jgi:hypothetical protein
MTLASFSSRPRRSPEWAAAHETPFPLMTQSGHRSRLLASASFRVRAKLTRVCFSILREGSREFSDEWLHEERAERRRNVYLHAKRLKL